MSINDEDEYKIYEEDEDYIPEMDFQIVAEAKAYERVQIGSGEEGTEFIQKLGGKSMAEVYRAIYRLGLSDESRFRQLLGLGRYKLYKYDIFINESDLDIIRDFVLKISPKKINYMNVQCLILGYYITGAGRYEIDKEKLENIKTLLPKLEDITLQDLIRYCRYWIINFKK